MSESRLGLPPSRTQNLTTSLLATHGFFALISAPVLAHFADQTPNRKKWLLASIVACGAGTGLVASTFSGTMLPRSPDSRVATDNQKLVWSMFLGRIIQGVASSVTWITAFAMLVENIDPARKGSILALAMSFVSTGVIGGPVLSGAMFEWAGYWVAWSIPFTLLFLNLLLPLAMADAKRGEPQPDSPTSSSRSPESESQHDETTGLLSGLAVECNTSEQGPDNSEVVRIDESVDRDASRLEPNDHETESKPRGFYRTVLVDPRILTGLANTLGLSIIFAGFDTTLPLYLFNNFHWSSLPMGMMFLGLQGPPILLGPFVGILRDRIGLRFPTVLGWTIMVPFLWLIATPAKSNFSWASPETHGETVVITSIVGVGFGVLLIRGSGAFQLIGNKQGLISFCCCSSH